MQGRDATITKRWESKRSCILIDERDDVKASDQSFVHGLLGSQSPGVEGRLPRLPLDALVPYITSFHARSCSLNSHAPISRLRYLAPLSPRVRGCIGDICCAPSRSLPPFSPRSRLLIPTDPAQFVRQVHGERFAHLARLRRFAAFSRREIERSNREVNGALM